MSDFKTVYQINPNTGEYIGAALAHKNPMSHLDGIEFNIPASCVEDEPPAKKAGKAIIRNGDKWEYAEDNRGEVYSTSDGSMKIQTELRAVEDGYTKLVPGRFQKWNGKKWVDDADAKAEYEKQQNNIPVMNDLLQIDLKSIRSLREWLANQSGAPDFIKNYEKKAAEKRTEIIK